MGAGQILDATLPIVDAHHHLWPGGGSTVPYLLADLHADTATGHNIVQTVFVECHSEYRTDGPTELRPVGETEFVAAAAAASAGSGQAEIGAIVGYADLCLGDGVEAVLQAHAEVGRGRFRGIRYTTAWDAFPMNNNASRAGIMAEPEFRRGVKKLGASGYSYDVMCFHTQLLELVDLARSCPEVTIVANHLGVPIAGGPYRGRAVEVRAQWRSHLAELARCENVVLKIGALIRPLTGERWDKRGVGASSEEIVAAWGDEIRYAIERFGPSRCLFESNFPVDKACFGYVEVWNAFKQLTVGFTPTEKLDLFHNTATRVYRLPPAQASMKPL